MSDHARELGLIVGCSQQAALDESCLAVAVPADNSAMHFSSVLPEIWR